MSLSSRPASSPHSAYVLPSLQYYIDTLSINHAEFGNIIASVTALQAREITAAEDIDLFVTFLRSELLTILKTEEGSNPYSKFAYDSANYLLRQLAIWHPRNAAHIDTLNQIYISEGYVINVNDLHTMQSSTGGINNPYTGEAFGKRDFDMIRKEMLGRGLATPYPQLTATEIQKSRKFWGDIIMASSLLLTLALPAAWPVYAMLLSSAGLIIAGNVIGSLIGPSITRTYEKCKSWFSRQSASPTDQQLQLPPDDLHQSLLHNVSAPGPVTRTTHARLLNMQTPNELHPDRPQVSADSVSIAAEARPVDLSAPVAADVPQIASVSFLGLLSEVATQAPASSLTNESRVVNVVPIASITPI